VPTLLRTGDLRGVGYHEIDSLRVAEYIPSADGGGPGSEVHVLVQARGVHHLAVLRIGSPAALDELIESLAKYRRLVWPTIPGAASAAR
jgi:hypothetical protein